MSVPARKIVDLLADILSKRESLLYVNCAMFSCLVAPQLASLTRINIAQRAHSGDGLYTSCVFYLVICVFILRESYVKTIISTKNAITKAARRARHAQLPALLTSCM